MIKKLLSISSILLVLLFSSCASKPEDTNDSQKQPPVVEAPDTDTVKPVDNEDNTSSDTVSNTLTDTDTETDSTQTESDISSDTDTSTDTDSEQDSASSQDADTNTDEASADDTQSETAADTTTDSENDTQSDTDTSVTVGLNSSDTDSENTSDETSDSDNESLSDLEVPEDFEEPLVRDLIFPDSDSDSDSEDNDEASEDVFEEEFSDYDEEYDFENEDEDSEESDDETEDEEENLTEEEPEPEVIIIPSRSVTLRKGENLAIVYPGSGWIYMGSLSEYNNMASKGRKLGSKDTKYTLLAKEAGTQIHHFYKVDTLTGEYIDDYIEITVLEQKGSSKTTITAPDYSEIVPKQPEIPAKATEKTPVKPEPDNTENESQDTSETKETAQKKADTTSSTTTPSAAQKTSSQKQQEQKKSETQRQSFEYTPDDSVISVEEETDDISVEDEVINIEEDELYAEQNQSQLQINTDEILENAKAAFESGDYEKSFTLLTEFFEYAIDRQDEALYLQGQLLEADSAIKDVKGAIQAYELLVKNYPSSEHWNDANKRIKYLRRFYYLSN
ncbi:MAG: hypothetical protein J5527_03205 [Treponema sp.]|nr:hypothetical protein [Treponema sp.]